MVRPKHTGGVGSILKAKRRGAGERLGDPWYFGNPSSILGEDRLNLRATWSWNGAPRFSVSRDGGKILIANGQNNLVYQYTLSEPFSFLGTEAQGASFNPGFAIGSITFRPDGTRMFLGDSAALRFKQYDLATPWDTSTAVLAGQSPAVGAVIFDNLSVSFDGTKLIGKAGSNLHVFNMSTPWDVTTGAQAAAWAMPNLTGLPSSQNLGLQMTPNGKRICIVSGYSSARAGMVELATPNDPTSAWTNKGFITFSQSDSYGYGAIGLDGLHVFLGRYSGGSYSDVYAFSLEAS